MNITELKELAAKATPGPWKHRNGRIFQLDYETLTIANVARAFDGDYSPANGELLAAANPAAILELIAQLEDAQGEIRALRATEAGLRDRLAAVEADRAQRVPDGKVLVGRGALNLVINALRRDAEQGRSVRGEMADALIASTPAPAQQEASGYGPRLMPQVSGYGPPLETLVSNTAHHQEPPQQERKPMTEEQVYAMCDRLGLAQLSPLDLVAEVERHHGIKE